MAISRTLRNVLKVRALEEEQHRASLESALGDLRALENALSAAQARLLAGRSSMLRAIEADDKLGRRAAQLECDTEVRRSAALEMRLPAARQMVAEARANFLEKRIERRQVESLVDEAQRSARLDEERRLQRSIDDRFNNGKAARAAASPSSPRRER